MDLRSGDAFWPIQNGLLQSYPPLAADATADVVVIGAGVTGALVAHALSGVGADVIVLDRRDVASGSSAATTGLLMYETDVNLGDLIAHRGEVDAVRAWRMGQSAIEHLESLAGALGDACGFARRPTVYAASSKKDARALVAECAIRRGHGFDVEWLEASALRERFGVEACGAIVSAGSAEIDCFRFTHRLLHAAAQRGARVFDRTEVTSVTPRPGGLVLRTDRGASVETRYVVWAAGYEGVEETQQRVGQLHSTWVVASEPVAGPLWPERALLWESARPYLYARTAADGRVLIGGEDEPFHRRHTNERVRAKKTARLTKRFGDLVPGVAFETAYEWSGVFSTTKDGLPYIGGVPEHPHAWLALGYGGNGITFSMIAAHLIRDAFTGTTNPDARIFAFDR